jgi:hypothetical protein
VRGQTPASPPIGYECLRVVGSFEELIATPLEDGVSAVCWTRALPGDFGEVARALRATDDITAIDETRLSSLDLSALGREAVGRLLGDLRLLRAAGHDPTLECVRRYPRDHDGPVTTDVYSFHVDSATVPTETFLCTYAGAASKGLRHDDARRIIDVPSTRARLLEHFGGDDGPAFAAWLHENCYDLHYEPTSEARLISFGVGNLWRIAVQYPGCPVPAWIHRAPEDSPGLEPRLLLIS